MPCPPAPLCFSDAAQLTVAAKLFYVLAQPPKSAGKEPETGPMVDISYGEIFKRRVSPAANVLVNRGCLPGRCSIVVHRPFLKPEVTSAAATEGADRSSGLGWQ